MDGLPVGSVAHVGARRVADLRGTSDSDDRGETVKKSKRSKLLDSFASAALPEIISGQLIGGPATRPVDARDAAAKSYEVGEAMLAERERRRLDQP